MSQGRVHDSQEMSTFAAMITLALIAFTAIVSFAAFNNEALFQKLCLYPYAMEGRKNEWYRFISVGFVHADPGHLIFNMITLWFFGRSLEGTVFSEVQFLLFYLSALIVSALPDYQQQRNNPHYRACGASGAVSAVLFSLVLFEPWGVIYLKFIIPIYFILFAAGYLAFSWYKSKRQDDNIAHGVHFWGALYGIAYTLVLHPSSLRYFLEAVRHPPFL